jgi:hypothetical protein
MLASLGTWRGIAPDGEEAKEEAFEDIGVPVRNKLRS